MIFAFDKEPPMYEEGYFVIWEEIGYEYGEGVIAFFKEEQKAGEYILNLLNDKKDSDPILIIGKRKKFTAEWQTVKGVQIHNRKIGEIKPKKVVK